MTAYPQLEIDLNIIRNNAARIKKLCGERGIDVWAVVKGVNALPEITDALVGVGFTGLATSRLSQIEKSIKYGIHSRWLLLRIPQMCECADVVRLADVSLESSIDVIRELEKECVKQNRTHKVIMMADTGDLREGYWDREELLRDCMEIKKSCPHITVAGVGTNFTDYGGTVPTAEKLTGLVKLAERMEEAVGHPMEFVSGGGTTTLPLVINGTIPTGINHLRIGEAILLNHDLPNEFHVDEMKALPSPVLLRAQVIEVFDKPSAPVGETATDAFDNHPVFEDRGIRRRAILGFGRLDAGDAKKLVPTDKGVEILAATSDHTIIDIEDCPREIKVGDVMEFRLTYENIMYATASPDVKKVYKNG
ncbi:MAG: alanine racemase [Eubacteriales bacterium]|nr:alanine racemase [Eubacteriales bacterium]